MIMHKYLVEKKFKVDLPQDIELLKETLTHQHHIKVKKRIDYHVNYLFLQILKILKEKYNVSDQDIYNQFYQIYFHQIIDFRQYEKHFKKSAIHGIKLKKKGQIVYALWKRSPILVSDVKFYANAIMLC